MGLDMYLHKRTYVGNKYRKPEQQIKIKYPKAEDGVTFMVKKNSIDDSKISEIIEDAAYWRKANAIHSWFVQNVQGGEDDCKEYYVTLEQLEALVTLCETVLEASVLEKGKIKNGQRATEKGWEDILENGKYIKNAEVAHELLPAVSGFFFGSTEYDQWYYQNLEETVEQLKPLIEKNAEGQYIIRGDYYYHSSW